MENSAGAYSTPGGRCVRNAARRGSVLSRRRHARGKRRAAWRSRRDRHQGERGRMAGN